MQDIVLKAYNLAEVAHRGQVRKYSGAPFIVHPTRVMLRATEFFPLRDDIMAAALLHDTVEDTPLKIETIRNVFGDGVANMVHGLTARSKQEEYASQYGYMNRAKRKAVDLEYLSQQSRQVRHLKLLDRIDNLEDMTDAPPDFLRLYLRESRDLADACYNKYDLYYVIHDRLLKLVADMEAKL